MPRVISRYSSGRDEPHRPPASWRAAFYPEGYHLLTRDRGAATILRDIVTWALDHDAPLPSGAEWPAHQKPLRLAGVPSQDPVIDD